MPPRRVLPTALIAVLLVLAACGEGSEEDQVTEAISDAYAAFAEGDAEAFCDRLSPDYLADFKDYYDGCDSETIGEVLAAVPGSEADALESPEITDIEVKGHLADATVNGGDLELVDVDGEWKLDDFDVPGGE